MESGLRVETLGLGETCLVYCFLLRSGLGGFSFFFQLILIPGSGLTTRANGSTANRVYEGHALTVNRFWPWGELPWSLEKVAVNVVRVSTALLGVTKAGLRMDRGCGVPLRGGLVLVIERVGRLGKVTKRRCLKSMLLRRKEHGRTVRALVEHQCSHHGCDRKSWCKAAGMCNARTRWTDERMGTDGWIRRIERKDVVRSVNWYRKSAGNLEKGEVAVKPTSEGKRRRSMRSWVKKVKEASKREAGHDQEPGKLRAAE